MQFSEIEEYEFHVLFLIIYLQIYISTLFVVTLVLRFSCQFPTLFRLRGYFIANS